MAAGGRKNADRRGSLTSIGTSAVGRLRNHKINMNRMKLAGKYAIMTAYAYLEHEKRKFLWQKFLIKYSAHTLSVK